MFLKVREYLGKKWMLVPHAKLIKGFYNAHKAFVTESKLLRGDIFSFISSYNRIYGEYLDGPMTTYFIFDKYTYQSEDAENVTMFRIRYDRVKSFSEIFEDYSFEIIYETIRTEFGGDACEVDIDIHSLFKTKKL